MDHELLTLTSNAATAVVDIEAGGRLASLIVDGVELLVPRNDDPVMWGCYPMVPFAGRIRDGRFAFDGTTYAMPKNFGDHAMHGFGFTSPWHRIEDNTIALEFSDPWPFAGRVQQHFAIDDDRFTMRITASADVRQPMMLGWHPWFNKTTPRGNAVLDFQPGAMFERGEEPLPTGQLLDPKPGPWDDCFTEVVNAPSISWGDLSVSLVSNAKHWVVFDELHHAICVEPQTDPPNAFNHEPTIVEAGDALELIFSFDW